MMKDIIPGKQAALEQQMREKKIEGRCPYCGTTTVERKIQDSRGCYWCCHLHPDYPFETVSSKEAG